MSMIAKSNYCDFIEIDINTFQCVKCDLVVTTQDGDPPIFICPITNNNIPTETRTIEKIVGFLGSVKEHIANGLELSTDEEILQRFRICNSCEFYQNNKCKLCGCPIFARKSMIGKLSWKSSTCPIKKW